MRSLACILVLVFLVSACKSEPEGDSGKAGSLTGLLTRGQEAFKSGQYDQALQAYQEALKQQPDSAVIYNLVGMAYRFKYNQKQDPGLKQKEIEAFSKAVQLQPNFIVALVNLGSTHYYSGNKAEASKHFRKVVELAPNHPEAEMLNKMIAESESKPTEE